MPDDLCKIVRPLLPSGRIRPQGGGVANTDDEAVFAAIVIWSKARVAAVCIRGCCNHWTNETGRPTEVVIMRPLKATRCGRLLFKL